jgi:hypothetical protein
MGKGVIISFSGLIFTSHASAVSLAHHDIFRVKGNKFSGTVNLSDRFPVPVVPLATDHTGKQFVVTLSSITYRSVPARQVPVGLCALSYGRTQPVCYILHSGNESRVLPAFFLHNTQKSAFNRVKITHH